MKAISLAVAVAVLAPHLAAAGAGGILTASGGWRLTRAFGR
ncbi:MAG TPA: hypothetical protein VFE30_12595 [Anaeromyxobacteraceae bacterium]|jgi:hypothetical protein|nr:hypothetical protein [Anaeromyxobacteraceae bacterium]